MKPNYGMPYLKCGKVCKVELPEKLSKNAPPINLATVKINTKDIKSRNLCHRQLPRIRMSHIMWCQ